MDIPRDTKISFGISISPIMPLKGALLACKLYYKLDYEDY